MHTAKADVLMEMPISVDKFRPNSSAVFLELMLLFLVTLASDANLNFWFKKKASLLVTCHTRESDVFLFLLCVWYLI